ncbi:MAG: DMT family transporter [Hespellia sp.]|nr:DMT family transporter [Hespellia sp.]
MTEQKKHALGHVMACGTQIMWGATFVSTKVLLSEFSPIEVLMTRAVLALIALLAVFPHRLKIEEKKREFYFAGAALCGIVLYFMLENTALTLTYASNVGIIVTCAPFFVAVMVSIFFKSEKPGKNFYIGFVIAIIGVAMISLNGQGSLHLNPAGDGLAFLAMISWGMYSAFLKKISEWNYPMIAVTRRIYFYGIVFLIPIALVRGASWSLDRFRSPEIWLNFLFLGFCASALGFLLWNISTKWIGAVKTSVYIYISPIVTVVLSVFILHEKLTLVSIAGAVLILSGLILSQQKLSGSRQAGQ